MKIHKDEHINEELFGKVIPILRKGNMNTVTVKKEELLETLKMNKDNHRTMFLEAQEGYRIQVINELDKMLREAKMGKRITRLISLPEPVDRTEDYETVIRMLEMSVDDEIEMHRSQFNNYVLDKWDWSEMAISTNSMYIGS